MSRFRVPVNNPAPIVDDGVKRYVSYIRLSKERKGENQYGFEVQRNIITNFIKDGILIKEYDEFMSGTSKRKMSSKVYEAIEFCKQNRATLIVAKFDRLSRDVAFLQYVLNSKVEFICCDFPGTNELVLNILCSIASYEAKMIQSRIKLGLEQAKKSGKVLGAPHHLTNDGRAKGVANHAAQCRANPLRKRAISLITSEVNNKTDWATITNKLNENGFKTSTGLQFSEINARMLYKREISRA